MLKVTIRTGGINYSIFELKLFPRKNWHVKELVYHAVSDSNVAHVVRLRASLQC